MLYAAFNPRREAWKFGFSDSDALGRARAQILIPFAVSDTGTRADERAIFAHLEPWALGNEYFRNTHEVVAFVAWCMSDFASAIEFAHAHPRAATPKNVRDAISHRRLTASTR
jgi:hypothetical protein